MTKTLSFAAVHMCIAFSIVYLMTGNPFAGGAVALVEPLCNTVAFYFHERLWLRWKASGAGHKPSDRQPATVSPIAGG